MNTKIDLQELIEAVKAKMQELSYSETTIRQYTYVWRRLIAYAEKHKTTEFSMNLGLDFLEDTYGCISNPEVNIELKQRLRAVTMLGNFSTSGSIYNSKIKIPNIAEWFEKAYQEFVEQRKSAGISERTIRKQILYMERFSDYLVQQGLTQIKQIDIIHIHGFTRTLAVNIPTIYQSLCFLRVLLRFLKERDYLENDYSYFVPKIYYSHLSLIPSAYSKEEVEKILLCIDRANPKGKRDYAIILLAAKLGIRASDICSLTFENINWADNTINIIQKKTGATLSLPLLKEIGEAIINYIKHGRPENDTNIVFLRLKAPIKPLDSSGLQSIVSFYISRAGIEVAKGKKRGPHALRHSLATQMLDNNISLPVISSVLGHTSTYSTKVYLKVDVNQLQNCALDVPSLLSEYPQDKEDIHDED